MFKLGTHKNARFCSHPKRGTVDKLLFWVDTSHTRSGDTIAHLVGMSPLKTFKWGLYHVHLLFKFFNEFTALINLKLN